MILPAGKDHFYVW